VPNYTLKNIPARLYNRLQAAAAEGSHRLNQEILARLRRSFETLPQRLSSLNGGWIHETLASGEAQQLKETEGRAAFRRGIARAKARKQVETR